MIRAWCLLALLLPLTAAADPAVLDAQRAQVETLRQEVAGQIQLRAYDLLDELVYEWTQHPIFETDTPLVLADVSVPVGFGSGLEALVENHFVHLAIENRRTHVVLAHCPQCTAMVVHSGAKGTLVSRGADDPEVLAAAGALAASQHALYLDFEIEGSSLVLRARITRLEKALPIIYAKTLSSSTSSAALLRSGDQLKSAGEARAEYLDALQGRSAYVIPFRIGVRSYASREGAYVTSAPFVWLQVGAEAAFSQARAWTGSVSAGVSWSPQTHEGVMVQGRLSRLLSGSVSSLTHPDLYGFLGASLIYVRGSDALAFSDVAPSIDNLASQLKGTPPTATFAAFQFGLELRVKNRLGVGVFLEGAPALDDAQSIGDHLDLGLLKFQALGAEVSVCF